MPITKQIKIQYQIRELRYSRKLVPQLRLSGVWLEKAGFEIGSMVNIEVKHNQLILKPVRP